MNSFDEHADSTKVDHITKHMVGLVIKMFVKKKRQICWAGPIGNHCIPISTRELKMALAQAESDRDEARAEKESAQAEAEKMRQRATKARDSAKAARESAKAAKAGSEAERAKADTEIE